MIYEHTKAHFQQRADKNQLLRFLYLFTPSYKQEKRAQPPLVVLHTNQDSVYSSQTFRQAHEHYNTLRSVSRVGMPTNNEIIEAITGWIKEELFLDFGLTKTKDLPKFLRVCLLL